MTGGTAIRIARGLLVSGFWFPRGFRDMLGYSHPEKPHRRTRIESLARRPGSPCSVTEVVFSQNWQSLQLSACFQGVPQKPHGQVLRAGRVGTETTPELLIVM